MSSKRIFASRVFLPRTYEPGAFRGLGVEIDTFFVPDDLDINLRIGRDLTESFTYRPRAAVDDGYILRRNK